MAVSKFAVRKLIPAGSSDPRLDVIVGVILHVDAGNAATLYPYFNGPSGGIESHGFIKLDGTFEQYRDYSYEADANYRANSWVKDGKRYGFISIETQGFGAGTWNAAQLATIKRVILEAADLYGFPIRKCPGPFSPGIGYHTMWGAPSDWTPVAKSCPGPNRIKQFNSVLVPWFSVASRPPNKMDPASYYIGARGAHITWLGERLIAHGFHKAGDRDGYQPGPVFTGYDRRNVRAAQIANGTPAEKATGLPDKTLLVTLARAPRKDPRDVAAGKAGVQAARKDLNHASDHLDSAAKAGRNGKKLQKARSLVEAALAIFKPSK